MIAGNPFVRRGAEPRDLARDVPGACPPGGRDQGGPGEGGGRRRVPGGGPRGVPALPERLRDDQADQRVLREELGSEATTRNWKTVTTLDEMAAD